MRIVLTGGPGGGKTGVLEMVRRSFCEHVVVLPEAASILFGGGFPRLDSPAARREAQVSIFHLQHSLERLALEEWNPAVLLCDRGTLDGLAYWPGTAQEFFAATGADRAAELARYDAVIHLRTPPAGMGYGFTNPLRIERSDEAEAVDRRILECWSGHPDRAVVGNEEEFLEKAAHVVEKIRARLPACCARHRVPEIEKRRPDEEATDSP